ncbi:hypothetical protein E3N88_18138 [Mikania micrantha]|uniref:Uncharacterized protein n=1 Tax=Mikania micrantha TaxID=192012 RepID=A0A5N6NTS3_9ASTR|nr:hypothetical protein E3N88_18138 [Mikania micrantha]
MSRIINCMRNPYALRSRIVIDEISVFILLAEKTEVWSCLGRGLSHEMRVTLFTPPPLLPSVETPSPIEVSSDTIKEVTVSDDKDIKENYGSNLEEPPGSLAEDCVGQVITRNENIESNEIVTYTIL